MLVIMDHLLCPNDKHGRNISDRKPFIKLQPFNIMREPVESTGSTTLQITWNETMSRFIVYNGDLLGRTLQHHENLHS